MILANLFGLPAFFAHEAYVLTPVQVIADKSQKVVVWGTLRNSHNLKLLIIFTLATVLLLGLALFFKSRPVFQKIGKRIDKATVFAPDLIRVVFGASLIVSAQHHSVFGPELPIDTFAYHQFIAPFMYLSGVMLILGIWIKQFAIATTLFWIFLLADKGWYMLTYLNYLGEAVALILLSKHKLSLAAFYNHPKKSTDTAMQEWSMPVARILFGLSLAYAAINIKFITPAVPLDVAVSYDLARYFHLDPLFIVLGAGLVELMIAGLFIVGLLQRINSLLFIGFIVLSLAFFKESVWPHYLLLGLAAGIFLHKPDKLALDSRLFNKKPKS